MELDEIQFHPGEGRGLRIGHFDGRWVDRGFRRGAEKIEH
jgi:hypothetical protein